MHRYDNLTFSWDRIATIYRYAKSPFSLLCFAWAEVLFHDKVKQLDENIDLNPVNEGQRFYARELHKHHLEGDEKFPPEGEALYKKLQAIFI